MFRQCLRITIFLIAGTLTSLTWADNTVCSTNSDCKECRKKDGSVDNTQKAVCDQMKMSCKCVPKKEDTSHSSTDAYPDVVIPTGPN